MSKNKKNKKNVQTAPATPAVENQETKSENVNAAAEKRAEQAQQQVETREMVLNPNSPLQDVATVEAKGLDPNHRVDLLKLADKYYNNAQMVKEQNISDDVVKGIHKITMIGIAAAFAEEMTFSKTPFAAKLRATSLPEMKAALSDLGINAEKILALPVSTDGTVTVQQSDIKIPADVKKTIKAEHDVKTETPILDPTKIENQMQLQKSILYLLVDKGGVYENINKAIEFYRGYLVHKATGNEKEVARIKSLSTKDLLMQIAEFPGTYSFVLQGIGRYLLRLTIEHQSVVPAFCIFRNTAKSSSTDFPAVEERSIADICGVIVNWAANAKIIEKKKNIDILNNDPKANKDAIAATKAEIKQLEDVQKLTVNPDSTFADNLISNLDTLEGDALKTAQLAFNIIAKSYYPGVNLKKKYENLKSNVQQYAGVATSLFRDVLSPLSNYSLANISELVEAKEEPAETKTESETKSEEQKETKEETKTEEQKPAEKQEEAKKEEPEPAEKPKSEEKGAKNLGSRKGKK